jgi:hypothetical protein
MSDTTKARSKPAEAPPTAANTVRLHRVFATKPEKVYRAFLDADGIAKWLPPHGFIRMLAPTFDIRRIAVKRRNRKNRWFKRGTMFRAVLGVLKIAKGPLTVREIAVRLLADKGEADPNPKTIRELERRAFNRKHSRRA